MKNYFVNLLCIAFINVILYLSINISEFFIFILVNFFYFLIFIIIRKIDKLIAIDSNQNAGNLVKTETAEDHPVIKSARERLGK